MKSHPNRFAIALLIGPAPTGQVQCHPNWNPPSEDKKAEDPGPRKANIPDMGSIESTSPGSMRGLNDKEQAGADADKRITAHPFGDNEGEAGIPQPKASPRGCNHPGGEVQC